MVGVVAGAVLTVACPAAFGALGIFMEFSSTELPTHMMGSGMMGIDMWMIPSPGMVMILPAEYTEIIMTAMAPMSMRIEVNAACTASFGGMLLGGGTADEWVERPAEFRFLGVTGMAPSGPAMAQCAYSQNGEVISVQIGDFTGLSAERWSFTGIEVTLFLRGFQVQEPKEYAVEGVHLSLVEPTDSGEVFSIMTPEPITLSLLALGGLGILLRRKRT